MIVAKKKVYLNTMAKLLIIFGLVLTIGLGIEIEYVRMAKEPFLFAFIALILLSVIFILPAYLLIGCKEINIDKRSLILKSQPFDRKEKYDLLNLQEWELKNIPTRYSLGNNLHLYLRFADKKQIHLSDMEFTNFDKIIRLIETEFKTKKRKNSK